LGRLTKCNLMTYNKKQWLSFSLLRFYLFSVTNRHCRKTE